MGFHLRYTDKVVGQLGELPGDLVDGLEFYLRRLAAAPAAVSVRIASPPFPPRGQLYQFTLTDAEGLRWFVTVIFRYSQDEGSLHLLSVTWRELDL